MAIQACTVTGTILDAASAGWTGTVRLRVVGDEAAVGGYPIPSSVVVTSGTFTSTVLLSPVDLEWTFVNSDGTIADVQQVQIADGYSSRTLTQIFGGAITLPAASLGKARAYSLTAAPTGTTDTATGLMAGLALAFTPRKTGNFVITATGNLGNGTAADAAKCRISYGTGTAPTNGAALAGTAVGNLAATVGLAALVVNVPFSCSAYVTGATVGTALWIDLYVQAVTGGTAAMTNVALTVVEV